MEKLIKKPKDNQKVRFTDFNGKTYDGLYIQSEDMFFIGFEESGDFLFRLQVKSWKEIK